MGETLTEHLPILGEHRVSMSKRPPPAATAFAPLWALREPQIPMEMGRPPPNPPTGNCSRAFCATGRHANHDTVTDCAEVAPHVRHVPRLRVRSASSSSYCSYFYSSCLSSSSSFSSSALLLIMIHPLLLLLLILLILIVICLLLLFLLLRFCCFFFVLLFLLCFFFFFFFFFFSFLF